MKLNLGCGRHKLEGFINIDKVKECHPDIHRDLIRGLPFGDNTIDEIFTSHTFEHLKGEEDFIFVMNECYRVLKSNGILRIVVPSGYKLEWALRDPTHNRVFFEQTFWYFCGVFPLLIDDMGITCKFKILEMKRIDRIIKSNEDKVVQEGVDLDVILQK